MKVIDIHTHLPNNDPQMDEYVQQMDAFDVRAALVLGVPKRPALAMRQNDDVLRAVEKHPGRLYGGMYIDLMNPIDDCIKEIEKYHAAGFVCVKLFPHFGYDPNDEKFEPVWKTIESLGLFVLTHCGWLLPFEDDTRLQSITSSPFHFEVPARRHPKINFIFAHFGGGATYLETVVLTMRLKNCFGDVTPGWGKWVFEQRMPGLATLDFKQVMYGTDNMGANYGRDIQWWADTLRDMGRSDQDLENFFYNNAARILKIDDSQ